MENATALVLTEAKEKFTLAMTEAKDIDIINNVSAAFDAAVMVTRLEDVLSNQIMDTVFMPLMNKRIGFRTDRDPSKPDRRTGVCPKPYDRDTVRTAIIDAAANGLLPTGNQFNIIAGNMYPTKEGYTALLSKLKNTMGLVYSFEFDPETVVKSADPQFVAIPCRVSYKTNRENLKGWFKYVAMVKSNGETSTTDQLRGKAERKCKKAFFEFLTGLDLGDADADTVDTSYTEVSSQPAQSEKSGINKAKDIIARAQALKAAKNESQQLTDEEKAAIEAEEALQAQQDAAENNGDDLFTSMKGGAE